MQVLGISLVFQGLLPMQRVWVRSLIGELRSDMPHCQKIKMENRNNIVTNSVKTFKMVHILKKFFKNANCLRGIRH